LDGGERWKEGRADAVRFELSGFGGGELFADWIDGRVVCVTIGRIIFRAVRNHRVNLQAPVPPPLFQKFP